MAADLPEPVSNDGFPAPTASSVLLGRDLFFDPLLSGNRNIACASCHHPDLGTSDSVSLSIGEGATGFGLTRRPDPANPPVSRLPRNAPALYNLGAYEFTSMFHDGRLMRDPSARFGIRLPGNADLERPLPLLAAQALLPLIADNEMAGHPGENPVADAVERDQITGPDGAWQIIADRVAANPDYAQRFAWLLKPDEPLHITHIAKAIGDFITFEFRATNSPFDRFLAGDIEALTNTQLRGMSLFYGKAQCVTCHSGALQTDHGFHAIGMPQIGPGKGHGLSGHADHGRANVTLDGVDMYRFRTPSLRNVALTAPYGHNGAYSTLRDMIRHHLDPATMLAEYSDTSLAILPETGLAGPEDPAMQDYDEVLAIFAAIEIAPTPLNDREIDAIIAFLDALTDPISLTGRLGAPETVPSGLPVEKPVKSSF